MTAEAPTDLGSSQHGRIMHRCSTVVRMDEYVREGRLNLICGSHCWIGRWKDSGPTYPGGCPDEHSTAAALIQALSNHTDHDPGRMNSLLGQTGSRTATMTAASAVNILEPHRIVLGIRHHTRRLVLENPSYQYVDMVPQSRIISVPPLLCSQSRYSSGGIQTLPYSYVRTVPVPKPPPTLITAAVLPPLDVSHSLVCAPSVRPACQSERLTDGALLTCSPVAHPDIKGPRQSRASSNLVPAAQPSDRKTCAYHHGRIAAAFIHSCTTPL